MSIGFHNIRGIRSNSKWNQLVLDIKESKALIVGLLETKHSKSIKRIRPVWGSGCRLRWAESLAEGNSGGILVFWNDNEIKIVNTAVSARWVSVDIYFEDRNFTGKVVFVYLPVDQTHRSNCLLDLSSELSNCNLPLLVLGDFNAVRKGDERKDGNPQANTQSIRSLEQMVSSVSLEELSAKEFLFTWRNNQGNMSRIDRAFYSTDWLQPFPDIDLHGLPWCLSDHRFMWVSLGSVDYGPKPFRFINSWLEHKNFLEMAATEWCALGRSPLAVKLKKFKDPLKRWNKEVFGNFDSRINQLQSEINVIDKAAETQPFDAPSISRRAVLQSKLWDIHHQKEIYLRQISREKHLREGDQNSRYFHRLAAANKRKNTISALIIDDALSRDPKEIRAAIINFYKDLFSAPGDIRALPLPVGIKRLDSSVSSRLCSLPSDKEIKECVWSCHVDKAPGYDGFNFKAIRALWPTIGNEFTSTVKSFFRLSKMPRGISTTWITLIPKSPDPLRIEDFRPISSIGCIYKVISKLLSARMSSVMPSIISETQSAFIKGRQISEGPLIINETISWLKNKRLSGVLFKVDFRKAFDTLSWSFIIHMLRSFNFPELWIGWIYECISSARISILINGTPTPPFSPARGIRQGDPLSPLLFVLAAEGLSWMLHYAHQLGDRKGLLVGYHNIHLSHLQFADDTLILCDAKVNEIISVKWTLTLFGSMSGLQVNWAKSTIYCINVPQDLVDIFTCELGCSHSALPAAYLGFPIGADMTKSEAWQPLIKKIESKLAVWKGRSLSRAGRLTLIKSVMESLPVYFISLFKVPKSVVKTINSLELRFLWSHGETRGVALMKWKCLTKPVHLGGLGLQDLEAKNAAMMFKWWWNFHLPSSEKVLWKQVVASRYDVDISIPLSDDAWQNNKQKGPWRSMICISKWPVEFKSCLALNTNWILGCGSSLRFWLDPWCGSSSLKVLHNRLYLISEQKFSSVSEMGEWLSGEWHWTLIWRRDMFEYEIEELHALLELINCIKPDPSRDDRLVWTPHPSKAYTCRAGYELIHESRVNPIPSWHKLLWKRIAPPRVELLAWFLLHNKLSTKDNLMWSSSMSLQQSKCRFCLRKVEDHNHLFFHCISVFGLWGNILSWWGIVWVQHLDPASCFLAWNGQHLPKRLKSAWAASFLAVIDTIWHMRNQYVFEDTAPDWIEAGRRVKLKVWQWQKVYQNWSAADYTRFVESVNLLSCFN